MTGGRDCSIDRCDCIRRTCRFCCTIIDASKQNDDQSG